MSHDIERVRPGGKGGEIEVRIPALFLAGL
jgi:hypothetical protein